MSLSACTSVFPAELEARLRLHRLPELGPARFKKLLEAFGSASKAISAPPCLACAGPATRLRGGPALQRNS